MTTDDDDLVKLKSDSRDADDAGAEDERELPLIDEATPEQARSLKGPKKAAAIGPAITLKSTGVTVELDDAPTKQQTVVASPRSAGARQRSGGTSLQRGSGVVGPPSKKPPAALGAPQPEGSYWRRNRKWIIPLLITVGVIFLLLLFLLIKSLTTPESVKIAASANDAITPVNGQIDDADTIADFREAAHSARLARSKMGSLQTRSNEVGNAKERAALVGLLDAETSLLNAYSGLADVRRNNLVPVEKLVDQAKEYSRALISADGQMAAVGRTGAVDEPAISAAVDNMDNKLSEAQDKMAVWTKKYRFMKKKREQFAAQATQLEGYAATMHAQRSEVGRFSDAPSSETFSSGGTTVDGFKKDREALLSSVRSSNVGPLLTQAKAELTDALTTSVAAFDALHAAWASQSMGETVAEASGFPAYDQATNDVDSASEAFVSSINSARSTANSRYRSPAMPDV